MRQLPYIQPFGSHGVTEGSAIHYVFGHPDCHCALRSVTLLQLLLSQLSRVPKNIRPLLPALHEICWGLASRAAGRGRSLVQRGVGEDLPRVCARGQRPLGLQNLNPTMLPSVLQPKSSPLWLCGVQSPGPRQPKSSDFYNFCSPLN